MENNYPDILEKYSAFKNKQIEPKDNASLIEIIKKLNDIEHIEELRQLYLSFCTVKQGNKNIGIDFLTKWYERELGIFSNVMRIANGEDDKILLIIGSDHMWTLRSIFKESGIFEVEELDLASRINY